MVIKGSQEKVRGAQGQTLLFSFLSTRHAPLPSTDALVTGSTNPITGALHSMTCICDDDGERGGTNQAF